MRALAQLYRLGLVWLARVVGLFLLGSGCLYGLSNRASTNGMARDYGLDDALSRAAIEKSVEISNGYFSVALAGFAILLAAEALSLLSRREAQATSAIQTESALAPAHR